MPPNPKKLLVEGASDKRAIPYLIENNGFTWECSTYEHVVKIKEHGGYSNLLQPGLIESELKESGLRNFGIIIDADENADARFQNVSKIIKKVEPNFPETIDENGTIYTTNKGVSIGIWVMPDNKSRGMFETFLSFIANRNSNLFKHAISAADSSKPQGSSFKDCHVEKAYIHTWLAWQDPPGLQLHQAIHAAILDCNSPYAEPFVKWFAGLYNIQKTP